MENPSSNGFLVNEMQKKNNLTTILHKTGKRLLFPFFIVQFCLWLIQVFEWITPTRYFSYAVIVLCLLYALLLWRNEPHTLLQIGACFFTLHADYFLILLQAQQQTLAMAAFLIAQLFYACRTFLLASSKKEKIFQLLLRTVLSVGIVLAAVAVLQASVNALIILSVVYYVQLLCSLLFAFLHFKEDMHVQFLAIGLLCFALCDLSIGFEFLTDLFHLQAGNLIYELSHAPVSFVSLFYPPSQTLLCVSVYPWTHSTGKNNKKSTKI